MYNFFGLVLLSALAAVGAERTKFNDALDGMIKYINDQQHHHGGGGAVLPEIDLGSKVKYSHAEFLGADSLKRTADAWKEVKGNDVTFDISYGYGMLTLVLPHLEIAGKNMSAYARIRDNSVHISFTLQHAGEQCHAKLNEFRVVKMENVVFGASDPEYDGSDVDGFFKMSVVPTLNAIIQSIFAKVEANLQVLCKVKDFQNSSNVKDILMSLL